MRQAIGALWGRLKGDSASPQSTDAASVSERAAQFNRETQSVYLGAKSSDEDAAPSAKPTVTVAPWQTLTGHADRVWSVDWHPSAPLIASCGGDKTVRIWGPKPNKPDSWHLLNTLDGEHTRTVRSVQWSGDGSRLACASFDATVSIWRLATGGTTVSLQMEAILDGHENEVKSVAWSADGNLIATCSRDKTVWIWAKEQEGGAHPPDEQEEDDDGSPLGETNWSCVAVMAGHTQDVKCVRFDPDSNSRVLSCGYDDTIKVWEESPHRKDDWHCVQTITDHTSTVWDLQFQRLDLGDADAGSSQKPPLRLVASASDDKTIGLYRQKMDPMSGNIKWVREATQSGAHLRSIYALDWAPPDTTTHSQLLASGSGDDSIVVHRIVNMPGSDGGDSKIGLESLATVSSAHPTEVNCVRWSTSKIVRAAAGGDLILASAADDGLVKLWKVSLA